MWERREIKMVLVGTPEGKRPLGRPRYRWKDDIKVEHRETGWKGVDRIHLAQDRDQWWVLVNMVMNLWVSSNAGNLLISSGTVNFSRRPFSH
jgi:hypothetical protein